MTFPIEYSTLSAKALLSLIQNKYSSFSSKTTITYLKRGFNDTYLIEDNVKKFILRIYKHEWRTRENIETELNLLNYLKGNGISVAYPISDKTNQLIQTIEAPEGVRFAVLFAFAEGEQVRKLNTVQAEKLGIEAGKIHLLTQNKTWGKTAQNYDVNHQFDITLQTLKPILENHIEAYSYLQQLKNDFETIFSTIDKTQIAYGICHGDLQAENFHIKNDKQITFFDFDFFGTGYLIYDIGVFVWYDHKNKPIEIINSFLKGYETQRKLSPTEKKLIPYFSTMRALFQMTLYCKISDGKQLPLWPAQQVADFIKKIEKWMGNIK